MISLQESFQKSFQQLSVGSIVWWLTAAGGLSLTYTTGLISYVGLDFAQIFSATTLVDAVSPLVLYLFLAAMSVLVLSVILRALVRSIEQLFMFVARICSWRPAYSHYLLLLSGFIEKCVMVMIVSYVSTALLGAFLGTIIAALLSLVTFWLIIFVVFRSPMVAFRSSTFLLMIFLLTFNVGYARAWHVSNSELRFVLTDSSMQKSAVNIFLGTASGLIVSTNPVGLDTITGEARVRMGVNDAGLDALSTGIVGATDAEKVMAELQFNLIREGVLGASRLVYIPNSRIHALGPSPYLKTEWSSLLRPIDPFQAIEDSTCQGMFNCQVSVTNTNLPDLAAFIAYAGGFLLASLGIVGLDQHLDGPRKSSLKNFDAMLAQ